MYGVVLLLSSLLLFEDFLRKGAANYRKCSNSFADGLQSVTKTLKGQMSSKKQSICHEDSPTSTKFFGGHVGLYWTGYLVEQIRYQPTRGGSGCRPWPPIRRRALDASARSLH